MIGVDTNVLVRFLADDDAAQSPRAAALFQREGLFLPKTVLLETEWVLRYSYRQPAATINAAFVRVLGLPNVVVEAPEVVARALEWHRQGMDFADALHLASCPDTEHFISFDRALAVRAVAVGSSVSVQEP